MKNMSFSKIIFFLQKQKSDYASQYKSVKSAQSVVQSHHHLDKTCVRWASIFRKINNKIENDHSDEPP